MPRKSEKTPKTKGNTSIFSVGGNKRAAARNTIHLHFIGDRDVGIEDITRAANRELKNATSTNKPGTPITPTSPGPQRDFQIHSGTVPDVYNFDIVSKLIPQQINGSTYNIDNTAIVYFVNINRDAPTSIPTSFPKAITKKCHPSRFFWVTVGWNDEKAKNQKAQEFELRNVIMRPTIQRGFQFMRQPNPPHTLVKEIMDSVGESLDGQEGVQRGWKNKFLGNLDNIWHSVEGKTVDIDDLTASDIIIAVMGPTGAGKSTFIKAISGYDVEIGHNLESCTSEVSIIRFRAPEISESNIALVDTPGFDDTNKSDLEIFKMIADWLDKTFKKKILLDGVLYLHRISDNRMAGTPYKNYQMFERLCGKSSFKQVILVTTMWDDSDSSEAAVQLKREKELQTVFWSQMLKNGSTTARFNENNHKASFNIIQTIVSNAAIGRQALTLQRELNEVMMELPETSAGRVMYSKLEALLEKQKRILEDLRREIVEEEKERFGGGSSGSGGGFGGSGSGSGGGGFGSGGFGGSSGGGGVDSSLTKMLKEEYQATELDIKTTVADLQAMKLKVPSRLLTSLKSTFQLRFSFLKS